MVDRPEHYARVVIETRKYMAERHSFKTRVREMVEIAGGH
jgi:hypothetical protein